MMLKYLTVHGALIMTFGLLTASQLRADDVPVEVKMTSLAYVPKQIEITPGQSVVWLNAAPTDHSAVSDDGKTFDTGLVAPKANSEKIAFQTPGTYPYHCKMHGKTMNGVVVVKAKP